MTALPIVNFLVTLHKHTFYGDLSNELTFNSDLSDELTFNGDLSDELADPEGDAPLPRGGRLDGEILEESAGAVSVGLPRPPSLKHSRIVHKLLISR